MPPPSKLAIATSSVQRLVREEASYHTEAEQQEERIKKLQLSTEEDNQIYLLGQERQALSETKALFPSLHKRIADAVAKLEEEMKLAEGPPEEAIAKAKATLQEGKAALEDMA